MIAALKSQRGALIGEGVTTYLLPRAALFGVRCARLPVLAHLFREREGIFYFIFCICHTERSVTTGPPWALQTILLRWKGISDDIQVFKGFRN